MLIENLLPHGKKLVLLDEIVSHSKEHIVARYTTRQNDIFAPDSQIEGFKLIEIMAQSLGVWNSLYNSDSQIAGLLLGARDFEIFLPFIAPSSLLEIHTKVSTIDADGGFGVYESSVLADGKLAARARLSVLSPDEKSLEKILNE